MFGKKKEKGVPNKSGIDLGKADPEFKFGLGDEVKEIITGYKGIIIYRTQWITNCNTYGVKSAELKDGLPKDSQHFDEPLLRLVEEKVVNEKRDSGGPTETVLPTNR